MFKQLVYSVYAQWKENRLASFVPARALAASRHWWRVIGEGASGWGYASYVANICQTIYHMLSAPETFKLCMCDYNSQTNIIIKYTYLGRKGKAVSKAILHFAKVSVCIFAAPALINIASYRCSTAWCGWCAAASQNGDGVILLPRLHTNQWTQNNTVVKYSNGNFLAFSHYG